MLNAVFYICLLAIIIIMSQLHQDPLWEISICSPWKVNYSQLK